MNIKGQIKLRKAYGNSMVPQLVYQIFKAIGEVENLLKLNQYKKHEVYKM